MKGRITRGLALLAVFAILPLMTAGECDPKPATIKVVSVTLDTGPSRDATGKATRHTEAGIPATKSDGGRYFVRANTRGTLVVTFTSSQTFPSCTLDLDGRRELSVSADGSGRYVVQRATDPLSDYRSVSGSLTCTPTTGFAESAISTFEVLARPLSRLEAQPSALDFGGQLVGSVSTVKTVKVTNTGDATAIFEYLVGAGEFDTRASIANRSILRRGASFTVTVRFTPTGVGTFSRVIGAVTSDNGPVVLFTAKGVAGTTAAASFSASTPWLKFPTAKVGGQEDLALTMSNGGITPMRVGWLAIAGNNPDAFRIVEDACTGARLAAGATCIVKVRFSPVVGGYATGILRVGDDAAGNPHEITLTGEGIAPAPTPDPVYPPPMPP